MSWQNIATLLIIHNTMSTFSHMRLNICNDQLFRLPACSPANYLAASHKLRVWHNSNSSLRIYCCTNAFITTHIYIHTRTLTTTNTEMSATYLLLSNFTRKCGKVSNTASGKMTWRALTLSFWSCGRLFLLPLFAFADFPAMRTNHLALLGCHFSLLTSVRFLLFV